MITLSTSGNSIIFIFQDNQHYLQNGTIEVPKNSLLLVTDESNMATFKKSASNDIFISALYSELGMTKAELEAWFEENATTDYGGGGGGDITSGEVQTMIDESISGKADVSSLATVATTGDYDDLLNKPTIPVVPTSNTAFTNDAGYITEDAISGKADTSAVTAVNDVLTAHTANTTVHVTAGDKLTWDGKQDALTAGTGIDITNNVISATGGGSTYSAGTNISIANDTISCTLPISGVTGGLATKTGNTTVQGFVDKALINGGYNNLSGSNMLTFIDGDRNTISNTTDSWSSGGGKGSCIIGSYNNVSKLRNYYIFGYQNSGSTSNLNQEINNYMFMFGKNNKAYNNVESTLGQYNNSLSASTTFGDSGNTLFSVGNGTADNARHNAFEIRQNGDIYISKDGQDVKLQDQLGGSTYTAGDGINIENDVISTSYSGYHVSTEPERFLTNFEGQCLILVPYDCEGSTQGDAHFDVDGHNYNFTFHPDNQTFDDNGDSSWQNYFSIEWDSDKDTFKLTTNENQPIDAGDDGCVRFKDLAPVILYSGTTTDGINGALDEINEAEQVTARALNDLNDRFGGLRLVKLSQQEYDGLTEKDSNTLYVIVN